MKPVAFSAVCRSQGEPIDPAPPEVPVGEAYQLVAMNAAARAKPDDFAPKGLVYVRYWWHVKRDIDCGNAVKIIEDGIAAGLGINDKLFLPASLFKETGVREPYTAVEVEYNQ